MIAYFEELFSICIERALPMQYYIILNGRTRDP